MLDLDLKSAGAILTLTALKGVGSVTAEKIIGAFGTLREACESPDEAFKGVCNVSIAAMLRDAGALRTAGEAAEVILARADELCARVLTCHDVDYPARLAATPERPLLIYAMGELDIAARSVACVGTKEPSDYGATVTRRVTERLADEGYTIVSGLTRGINSIALETALRCGGPAVAVVGSGLDALPTERHVDIGTRILDGGGCVVSEHPFGRLEDPGSIIRSCRIMSWVSAATFVMQTDISDASMHAIRYGALQGRLIFAPVPRGRYASEDKNQGILALSGMPSRELAGLIEAKNDFLKLLEGRGDATLVHGVHNRDQYDEVIRMIDAVMAAESALPGRFREPQGAEAPDQGPACLS